jgi:Short repeat of unknown function (DUF308)
MVLAFIGGPSLKRTDANRNLKTSLVGSGDKGYRCNCFWNYRVRISWFNYRNVGAVFWSVGIDRRDISHRRRDWTSCLRPGLGWQLVIGIVGIIVGLLTFHAPQITALALIIYIAAWALMIGASEIVLAIKMRREIKGEWFLILMGLASIVFAVLLLWNPIAGAAAVIWLIAWYAVVLGILSIFFGFRLRSLRTLAP